MQPCVEGTGSKEYWNRQGKGSEGEFCCQEEVMAKAFRGDWESVPVQLLAASLYPLRLLLSGWRVSLPEEGESEAEEVHGSSSIF